MAGIWRIIKAIWHPFMVAICWLTQYDRGLREAKRKGYNQYVKTTGRFNLFR